MTINDYLKNLGFDLNPFQFTNADKETELLSNYFIKPDYFEDVWGNPYEPVSSIVYAPRGAGKTAQRIMIEKRAKEYDDILAALYKNCLSWKLKVLLKSKFLSSILLKKEINNNLLRKIK